MSFLNFDSKSQIPVKKTNALILQLYHDDHQGMAEAAPHWLPEDAPLVDELTKRALNGDAASSQ